MPSDHQKSQGQPVVSVRGAVKTYGDFELGPVELDVEPGYVVAVVGPNGSGKSTLFRALMGLAPLDAGEIRLFGMRYPADEVAIKQRIGYVPERPTGHSEMRANELGKFVAHWYPGWDEALYHDLLRRFEIDAKRRFDKLSKGTQRRLSFAVALATDPDLLLLDEPTEGVDPFAREEMISEIVSFAEHGERAVLFTTHALEEVRRVADYVALLVNGELLGIYEKDALLEEWKTLWVDRVPAACETIPGLVAVREGVPASIVSRFVGETKPALSKHNVEVLRTEALELEEILAHIMCEHKKQDNE